MLWEVQGIEYDEMVDVFEDEVVDLNLCHMRGVE